MQGPGGRGLALRGSTLRAERLRLRMEGYGPMRLIFEPSSVKLYIKPF